eukprot:GFYU01013746.1.p1 GENE.GFYU01013746.1~~GFYU01013746.1.p1  ORF type:complete len:376 (-),score=82.78 GFYU01013746.1:643-1770(-)
MGVDDSGSHGEITLREYRDTDDAPLMQLEKLCPQGESIVITLERANAFIGRASQWQDKDRHVVVAEAEETILPTRAPISNQLVDTGRICGALCAGISSLVVHGKVVRVAYCFDLRVHPSIKRQGLGGRLMCKMEEILRAEGVDFTINGVNIENTASMGLMKKLHYTVFSELKILLVPVYPHSANPSIKTLSREETMEYVTESNKGKELLPTKEELTNILQSPCYEGTFTLTSEDGDSMAGLSLWNPSKLITPVVLSAPLPVRMVTGISKYIHDCVPWMCPDLSIKPVSTHMTMFNIMTTGPNGLDLLTQLVYGLEEMAHSKGIHFLAAEMAADDAKLRYIPALGFLSMNMVIHAKPLTTRPPEAGTLIFGDPRLG